MFTIMSGLKFEDSLNLNKFEVIVFVSNWLSNF